MQPKKSRQTWYVSVSVVFCLIISSLIANNRQDYLNEVAVKIHDAFFTSLQNSEDIVALDQTNIKTLKKVEAVAPFFNTIIANADITATCVNDGATLARFNLCGNFDNRVIALDQAYGTYEWERLTTSACTTFNIDEECPTYTCGGSWVAAGSASSLPSMTKIFFWMP